MAEDFASWLERLQDPEREEEMDRQQAGVDLEEPLVVPEANPPSISRFPSGGRYREDLQNPGKVGAGVEPEQWPEPS